jgi:hypothetical protein
MSAFDRFVAARGLTSEEIAEFIAFIGQTYDGPRYTRMRDEVAGYYHTWRKGEPRCAP